MPTRFEKLFEKSKVKSLTKYCVDVVATDLQRCVRAEHGAAERREYCFKDGKIQSVWSPFGQCVCITCGNVLPWAGSKMLGEEGMDAGHFYGRSASVVLDERGLHPQCVHCNRYLDGAHKEYTAFMLHKGGQELIDALRMQKVRGRALNRIELVERRIEILDRLKAAEAILQRGPQMATRDLSIYQTRQLTFDFDYSEAGLAPAKGEIAAKHGSAFRTIVDKTRRQTTKGFLDAADQAASAKTIFAKKPDATWKQYCKTVLQESPADVGKMIDTVKGLAKVDRKLLGNIPVGALYMLSQAPAKKRNEVIEIYKTHKLTIAQVRAIVLPESDTKEIAKSKIPGNHDELFEDVKKRLKPLMNKIEDTDIYEDLPTVLSELAQEIQGVDDE